LSPYVYKYFVTNLKATSGQSHFLIKLMAKLVPANLPWISVYWVFVAVTLIMVLVIFLSKFPVVVRKEDERAGAWATHKVLFKKKTVILYFFGIMAYVGTEQGVANWISQFLYVYHKFDPQTVGARAVSWFWGLMTIGCLVGLVLLKLIDSRKVLIIFALAALVLLSLGFFGPAQVARMAFPLVGFAASVMWSVIFSLALNSVASHHGSFSGILCTGIIGGALVPLIIGRLGDSFGLRTGMFFLYLTLGYILSIGFWARPLITNETIFSKRKKLAAAN
jgi:fucose permease